MFVAGTASSAIGCDRTQRGGDRDPPPAATQPYDSASGPATAPVVRQAHLTLTTDRLATIHWPVAESYRRLYPDRGTILPPPPGAASAAEVDAVLIYSAGELHAIDPRTGQTIWDRPAASGAQPELLGVAAGRYIFASPHRVFAVETASGRLAWQYGEEPPADAGADPESVASWIAHGLNARQLCLLGNRGDLDCLSLEDGALQWRRENAGRLSSLLAVTPQYVIITTSGDDRSVLAVRDAASGELIHEIPIGGKTPVSELLPADDETLLAVQSRTITALEPASGRIRCRITTRRRFVASTIHAADGGLYVSSDGRAISKYRLTDGQMLWTTPRVGPEASGGLWAAIEDGTLYVAAEETIAAFDAGDGRRLWRRENPSGSCVQPPKLTRDAIILVAVQNETLSSRTTDPGTGVTPQRHVVRRLDRATGREMPVSAGGPLVTDPLSSFGGVFLYEDALVVLDGGRLIGYVARSRADRPRVQEGANMTSRVHIDCFVEPGFGENAYVIWVHEQGPCWIVDPGPPPSAAQVIEHVAKHGLRPEAVLVTHGHIDHITGLPEILAAHKGVPVYIAAAERATLTDPDENLSSALGMPFSTDVAETRDLPPGGELVLDGTTWRILDTSGHSPGGRSFYCPAAKSVIVGDALFQMSIGRVDFHHSNGPRLLGNIREQLFTLPDDTRVLCGHGPNTTIGKEKQFNPFLQ
jgi:glyoxylase-like metal-dependent hydrolase (beta-lactamase superfamily II)/outer membrane protein assembly factor BamB